MTSILTFSRPAEGSPILAKAERDRPITRPRTKGPRSLMRTTTLLPLRTLVTLTCAPQGSVRCAAVLRPILSSWPLAGVRCWRRAASNDAMARPIDAAAAGHRGQDREQDQRPDS